MHVSRRTVLVGLSGAIAGCGSLVGEDYCGPLANPIGNITVEDEDEYKGVRATITDVNLSFEDEGYYEVTINDGTGEMDTTMVFDNTGNELLDLIRSGEAEGECVQMTGTVVIRRPQNEPTLYAHAKLVENY